jgi:uncharacterized protein YndB with AHSA1/START domain
MRLTATLPAPPAEVYTALTDPAELRVWFAEHVSEQGFWGRWTPQGDQPRQELVAAEPGRLLRFRWPLDGEQTTVDLGLAASAGGTELTVTQSPLPTLAELLAPTGRRDGRHTMHTFWPLALGNLADHLAGRPGIGGVDFSTSRAAEIRVALPIAAPAHEVWRSLTEPARVERWWGYAPEIEPRLGGKVVFGGGGRISAWEPDRVFAYTEEGMTTTWELAESDGATRLTFTQSGFGPDELDNAAQHDAGWRAGLLELRRMHELGEAWTPAVRELPDQAHGTAPPAMP